MTDEGVYARASKKVEDNLWKFRGMRFTTRDMQTACDCVMPERDPEKTHKEFRDAVTRYLYEQSDQQPKNKRPHLRIVGKRFYEVIDRTLVPLLLPTTPSVPLDFMWPLDVDSGMEFPFARDIIIEPKDIIAVSGESNRGKTALLFNIAVENAMRAWAGKTSAWISEWHPSQLQRRLAQYPGALNGDGQPIFNMYKLSLADIVDQIAEQPDYLHILDWVGFKDKFYDIAGLQERIVDVLNEGIAVIAGQKMEGKDYGVGGGFNEFNTSVLMTVSRLGDPETRFNRLKLMKVKSPREDANLDRISYRFKVVKLGARIAEVDEIKDCRRCGATGILRGGAPCGQCQGQGYTVVYRPIEERQPPVPVPPVANDEPDPEPVRF